MVPLRSSTVRCRGLDVQASLVAAQRKRAALEDYREISSVLAMDDGVRAGNRGRRRADQVNLGIEEIEAVCRRLGLQGGAVITCPGAWRLRFESGRDRASDRDR
jgi:hypothetical protein